MPNWVKNIVTFNDPKVLKQMLSKNKDGKLFFDFNKAVPMPKEIENTVSTFKYDDTNEETQRLIQKYGARDWYDWSIKNWGTKWNSGETEIIDDNTVDFNTAWSTPEKLIEELCVKFNTRVHVMYADEDLGRNCGEYCYSNGLKVESYYPDDNESFDYACDVWGLDANEERAFLEEE